MVERDLAKVDVAGSTPVSRSRFLSLTQRFPADGLFFVGTLTYAVGARYPSGKGEVCKTFTRRFDSDPRLQFFLGPTVLSHTINAGSCSSEGIPPGSTRGGGFLGGRFGDGDVTGLGSQGLFRQADVLFKGRAELRQNTVYFGVRLGRREFGTEPSKACFGVGRHRCTVPSQRLQGKYSQTPKGWRLRSKSPPDGAEYYLSISDLQRPPYF